MIEIPFKLGDVLQEKEGKARGVLVTIAAAGQRVFTGMHLVSGDLVIKMGSGSYRVTNIYSNWQKVDHAQQTYHERLVSWEYRDYEHDSENISRDEGRAVDGIMSLLPKDVVDWENGPWPDSLEDALCFLKNHLEAVSKKEGGREV